MANRLEFTTALDGGGFARGIRDMERLAGLSGSRLSNALGEGFGKHGGPGGGISGIIRESLVIIREFGRGNYTRIPGSATLLAQYLGGLALLYKSTAAEAVKAAVAERQLTEKMALAAVAARDKALATKAAVVASNLDGGASLRLALADNIAAGAATRDAEAQEKKAIATERSAAIALASATIEVTAFGYIAIAALALAVPLYFLWRHFENLATAARKFKEATDATSKTFSDEAKAVRENAAAHEELQKWLANELDDRKSLLDVTDRRLKQLREESEAQRELARARGDSMAQINAMEVGELEKEKQLLEVAQARAKADLDAAKDALSAADKAFTKNPTMDTPEGSVSLLSAQKALDESGKIMDSIQESIKQNPALKELLEQKKAGYKNASNDYLLNTGFHPIAAAQVGQFTGQPIDQAIAAMRQIAEGQAKGTFGATTSEAQSAWQKNSDLVDALTKKQQALADAVDNGKMSVKDANTEWKKFTDQLGDVTDQLGIKSGLGAQAAAAGDAKKNLGLLGKSPDSLVRVGNFLGTARSGIENMTAEMVRLARKSAGHLENIDRKMGTKGGYSF